MIWAPGRLETWLRRDGRRGTFRKIRLLAVYWRFRWLARRARRLGPVPPPGPAEPWISVLLVAYRTRPDWLLRAVQSVLTQRHASWELCVGMCELDARAEADLRGLARDPRIRLIRLPVNLGISENANRLAREARGEFLAVLDHDDYLEPHALRELAMKAASGPFDLVYSDEDVVSPVLGIPGPPLLKPDWAPETLRSRNYICHLCAFRRTLFEEVGGFRPEYDGAQDYDLFLRLTERACRAGHVPKVLYHWRRHRNSTAAGTAEGAKPQAWDAARRAVQDHLDRTEPGASAELGAFHETLRVRYRMPAAQAEILIPSADRDGTLDRCLRSLLARTTWPNYRVTVMQNGPSNFAKIHREFGGNGRVRFLDYREPFNFSRINNAGAAACGGDALVFLNDDVEITQNDWLEGLLEQVMRPGIGAAGPMLLYPDGTIQHAGISVDPEVVTWEIHKRLPAQAGGYHGGAQVLQNVSAVTGACLATPRTVFEDLGGFDESFPLAYNDIDYCLRLRAAGRRVVYVPHVRLVHHESLTRGSDAQAASRTRLKNENARMRAKWGEAGLTDRYLDVRMFRPGADLKSMARAYWRLPAPPPPDTADEPALV